MAQTVKEEKVKTIQIGNGTVKVIQFETLKEIQKIFTEKEIVSKLNSAYKIQMESEIISGSLFDFMSPKTLISFIEDLGVFENETELQNEAETILINIVGKEEAELLLKREVKK